jgi:hypothetical protein
MSTKLVKGTVTRKMWVQRRQSDLNYKPQTLSKIFCRLFKSCDASFLGFPISPFLFCESETITDFFKISLVSQNKKLWKFRLVSFRNG